ncbi:hypothetical protein [Nitrosopumilus sp. b3]|uniref:hypothetical protein n=1 Tax=Nitrosopumilus sp. b3 TaxID=2109909 RepID=UPI00210855FE|nr:hypothetical protein [Nitrosopumilus sp. b3]
MDKYEKLLNMLMDFNESIRFAAVCNKNGEFLWNSQRKGVKNIVPLEETKDTISRDIEAWKENSAITGIVGSGLYTIASYDKIKRITVPLDEGNMLFISVNNKPMSNIKGKSYGHLAEMGEILSIVDFIKAKK